MPPAKGSRARRLFKAVSYLSKEKRLKEIIANLLEYASLFTYFHITDISPTGKSPSLPDFVTDFPASGMKPLFMVSYEKDEDFLGRENVMEEIEQTFEKNCRVAICGMGGVG